MSKDPNQHAAVSAQDEHNEEIDWELKPGGMLVQKRDDEDAVDDEGSAISLGPMIKITVSHGPARHEVHVPAQSTFGDIKNALAQETGLEPKNQRLLFRGKEKEDEELLHMAGVKDRSKILLLEEPASKERKLEELRKREIDRFIENMSFFDHFFLPILLFSMLSFLAQTTATADPYTYLDHFCPNTTFFGNNIYSINLNFLLSSLSSNVNSSFEFYNTTSGENTSDPVYGLFLCRGDVTAETCRACVADAAKNLANLCSGEKTANSAIIWYDKCMLRYSNKSIFSTVTVYPRIALYNTANTTSEGFYNQLVNTTITELAKQASDVPIGAKKFRTLEVNLVSRILYLMVQCTPDLSSNDCHSCLQATTDSLLWCCDGKAGGRVLCPSCNFRYEFYRFFAEPTSPPMASPPPPPPGSTTGLKGKSKSSTSRIIAIVASVTVSMVLFIILGYCFLVRKSRNKFYGLDDDNAVNDITNVECSQLEFHIIETATNNFSNDNKLGEGGFGKVYKGTLLDGKEIAVKRLSKSSRQGAIEFRNEVMVVAKLQHRNLVKLLGFCLTEEEKILVYEYVPNGSLDNFLYDSKRQLILDWSSRYKIIKGIARGLLYLHEDSRLRIIHRDLKASNVLLESNMNPKISDFGLARTFLVDQIQGETNRIVGTYGYMSPEYAMHGLFSVKSDVFSFGVLLLEIVSGKKNNSYRAERDEDLLRYALRQWSDGTQLELLDPAIRDHSFAENEVIRCIHIGLLCVNEDPEDRPTMATIVLTLEGHPNLQLPEPTLLLRSGPKIKPMSSEEQGHDNLTWSVNEASISQLRPR